MGPEIGGCQKQTLLQDIRLLFGDAFINTVPLYDAGSPDVATSASCELGIGSSRQLLITVVPTALSSPSHDLSSSPPAPPQSNEAALYEFLGSEGLQSNRVAQCSSPSGPMWWDVQRSMFEQLQRFVGREIEHYVHTGEDPIDIDTVYRLARGDTVGTAPGVTPIPAVVQWGDALYVISRAATTDLKGLLTTFRPLPQMIGCDMRCRFVILQLVHSLQRLHNMGLAYGRLSPRAVQMFSAAPLPLLLPLPWQAKPASLPDSCLMNEAPLRWSRGEMSNFDYLMLLNNMCGRRIEDPQMQPVFPWVIDFKEHPRLDDPGWAGWRDLSKSKYRLTKGDEHLDFTYNSASPHHITDQLSEVTFTIYMARRIGKRELKRIVRSNFEPNEYPGSMEGLYKWTPDETVAHFYSDPTIFESMHTADRLADLQVPVWAETPQKFIEMHLAALESQVVSQQLHLWIDLTFGVGLSGHSAVESKNVVLSSEGSMPYERGIVQLFSAPHPIRTAKASLALLEDQLQFGQLFRDCWGCYGNPQSAPTVADDGFALGCVIAEVYRLGGRALFASVGEVDRYLSGEDERNWVEELCMLPPDIRELVVCLLARDPAERPSMAQLSQLPSVFSPELNTVYSMLAGVAQVSCEEQVALLREAMPGLVCVRRMEVFLLVIPLYLTLLQTPQVQIETLQLLDSVAGKLGPDRTRKLLRQPLQALYQSTSQEARTFLVKLEFLQILLDRFGHSSFLQHIFGLVAETLRHKHHPASSQALQGVVLVTYGIGPSLTVTGILPPLLRQLGKQNCAAVIKATVLVCLRLGETTCANCVLPQLLQLIRPRNHTYHDTQADLYSSVLQVLTGLMGEVLSERTTLEHLIIGSNPVFRMALAETMSLAVVPLLIVAIVKLCRTIGAANMRKHVMHYMHQLFCQIGSRLVEAAAIAGASAAEGASEDGALVAAVAEGEEKEEMLNFLWRELFCPLEEVVGQRDLCHAMSAGTSSLVTAVMLPHFLRRQLEAAGDRVAAAGCSYPSKTLFENEVSQSFMDSIPPQWVEPSRTNTNWSFEGVAINSFKVHESTSSGVRALCVGHRGQELLLSGGSAAKGGGMVRIWSIPRMMCIGCYGNHAESVLDLTIMDSTKVASCDHTVHIWDSQTTQTTLETAKAKMQVHRMQRVCANTLLMGTSEATIQTLDLRVGQSVCQWRLAKTPSALGAVKSLCLQAPDTEHLVVAGTSSGHVAFIDQRFGLLKTVKKAHNGQVSSLHSVGRDAVFSASGDRDGCVCVWAVANQYQHLQSNIQGFDGGVSEMVLSESTLFCASKTSIGMIDVSNPAQTAHLVPLQMLGEKLSVKSSIHSLAILSYHNLLAIGCDDGSIKICK